MAEFFLWLGSVTACRRTFEYRIVFKKKKKLMLCDGARFSPQRLAGPRRDMPLSAFLEHVRARCAGGQASVDEITNSMEQCNRNPGVIEQMLTALEHKGCVTRAGNLVRLVPQWLD